jgi:hypothetical protein
MAIIIGSISSQIQLIQKTRVQILALFLNLSDEDYEYRSFQQGGAITHTASNSMAVMLLWTA